MLSTKAAPTSLSNFFGKLGICLLLAVATTPLAASDLLITGVVDGPLSGGLPKAIELYVLNDIADLSTYGLGSANNGGGTDGQEFTFPSTAVDACTFLYVASESVGFTSFFGFGPDFTSSAAEINGDDAIELFQGGSVVDVFGDINLDGSGQPWEYLDGWTYRDNDTGPDGSSFVLANWSFSGPNALDGETTNATAATPFPLGTYAITGVDCPPRVQSTTPVDGASGVAVDADVIIDFSEDVNAPAAAFTISCSSSGGHTFSLGGGPRSFTLDPDSDFANEETCTVTVIATQVTDLDSDDPPDMMAADFVFSFDTAGGAPPAWVINEIHADPASGSTGDANGDGTRDFSDDEFVEIVNTSGSMVDISGWTLADGFTVRHTFPANTVVADGCGVVVFGGGTPTGDFGNVVVQTASSGALGLNNGGDTITLNDGASDIATATYGGEGGDNQSLTLDPDITGSLPYVQHTGATDSGGTLFSPGTRIDGSQFSGCAPLPAPWVLNEIHADPASGSPGDANGDGTRDFSADEFVEIVNNTGGNVDISGWTLADGFTVRHTFPSGTVVLDGCGIVVFGGGSPTGAFGNTVVQTASSGSLGLNNSGDSLTLNNGLADVAMESYGGEGGDNQSITLDPDVTGMPPYVKHTLATGSGGTLFSPGTRIDGSQFDGCPVAAEIFEIQGDGLSSPLEDKLVMTEDNVVTCLATDGFFMQTPAARSDADVDTSDGIFVFTNGAPTVAVGDLVDVDGRVDEFFGFTEINSVSAVTVVGSETVPTPVSFGATVPSPDPLFPSCGIEYECYEGMLIEIINGSVTGPNQRFGTDPIAEVHITAAPSRTFRETGIEFPGMVGLPLWDGNPEVFELDPDKLGLPNQIIPAGSSFSARGVLGFEFGGYELWPNQLSVVSAPLPVPVRPRDPGEMTVGSLNLFRLFDDVDDPPTMAADGRQRDDSVVSTAEYLRRRAKFAVYILNVLDAPDILAVQEAEKLGVLQDLAVDIATLEPSVVYSAYLEEGNDLGTIDVGFLVRDTVRVDRVTQLGRDETFVNPISGMDDILHDRPPLLLAARFPASAVDTKYDDTILKLSVLGVHNRSLGGIDGAEGERVRAKRLEQAQSIARMIDDRQGRNGNKRIMVLGDFNAFEFTDGFVDVIGQIEGEVDPFDNLLSGPVLTTPSLINVIDTAVPAAERYSFIFRGNAQTLDHALLSRKLAKFLRGAEFGRGNADAAVDLINNAGTVLRSSDHDGLVVYLQSGAD